MELLYTFIFAVQGLVFVLTLKFLHDIYFRNNDRGSKFLRFLAYTAVFMQSFGSCYWELEQSTIVSLANLVYILPILLIKTTWVEKILSYLFILAFSMTSEAIMVLFLLLFLGLEDGVPSPRTPEAVIMIVTSRLLTLILVYLYKKVVANSEKTDEEEKQIGFFSTIFHVITFSLGTYTLYLIFFIIFPLIETEQSTEGFLLGICIVFFFITNVISYIHNLDLEDYRRKTRLIHQEMERYSREHHALGEYLKELSVLKHDVKHQLLPLFAELPVENQKTMEKFNTIFDAVFSEEYQYFSNFPALDLLLNYQLYKAKQENIHLEVQMESNLEFHIKPDIFSVILGNLLDNSRESQEKLLDKRVNLQIMSQNTNIFLKVENSYEGEISLEQGLPPTSKPESSRHGLGLSTVKSLVEGEGGIFQLSTKNQIFRVEIVLLNGK
ncbi:MAG: ATP-binding protein [Eubacteriales bacterium]